MPTFPLRDTIQLNGREYTLYASSAAARNGGSSLGNDQETAVPQLTGEPVDISEEPLVMDTFHLGAFYSWRLLAGTYAWAINADARFPRLVLPGPFVNTVALGAATDFPRCAQDFAGDLYVGAGRTVYRIPAAITAPIAEQDLGGGISAWSMVTFGGSLYVGTSAGSTSTSAPGLLWQKSAGTWSNNASVLRKSLAQAWFQTSGALGTTGAFQMIGQDTVSSVRNVATAPLTPANWGASIPVGDTTYGINRLIGDQSHVYIAKTNGLHDLDGITGFAPNLMPFFASAIDDENGIAGHSSAGHIYSGHLGGLFRLDVSGAASSRLVTVTPGHGLPNETPIRGKITASTSYGAWQIVAVYNNADTYICWGRDIMQGDAGVSPFGYGYGYGPSPSAIGPSPMLWHGGIVFLPGQRCYLLYVSGLANPPRLWIGTGSSAGGSYQLSWCILPRTENPLQDPEYRFANSWQFFVPGQDWGHPATPKQLLQIDIEGDNLGAGSMLVANVNAEGGPFTQFGVANVSPQSQLLAAQPWTGRRIGLRLDGSGQSTTAAILRVLMPRAQIRVAVRPVRTYQLLLGEGNVDRFGGRDIQRAINDYRALQALQTGDICDLRDEFGESYPVLVQPPVERQLLYLRGESGKGTAEPVLLVNLRVKVLQPGPDHLSTAPWYWDDGTLWDSGRIWSTGGPPPAPPPLYNPWFWDDTVTRWDDGHTWSP